MTKYRCPGCGSVWDKSELLYSEGTCLTHPDECGWEDALEEIKCKSCEEGDMPKLLDCHGVIVEKSELVALCSSFKKSRGD